MSEPLYWQCEIVGDMDAEAVALLVCTKALEDLMERGASQRIARYLLDRYREPPD